MTEGTFHAGEAPNDATALCAVVGHPRAARFVAAGLAAMRHRGGGTPGIVVSEGTGWQRVTAETEGSSTTVALGALACSFGAFAMSAGITPTLARFRGVDVGAAWAGRLQNGLFLRRDLESRGAVFQGSDEVEVMLHYMAHSNQRTFVNRIVDALWKLEGSFSCIVAGDGRLIAMRDARGFRPLVLGRLGSATVLATEGSALRAIGAEVTRDVAPGEMVIVEVGSVRSVAPLTRRGRASCIQELVSLTRHDGEAFGTPAYAVRVALGERLAKLFPVPRAQVVVPISMAAAPVAAGLARSSRLPLENALSRHPESVTAVFSSAEIASHAWTAVASAVADRRVVLVIASLRDGTAPMHAAAALRHAGAQEVHIRIASPLWRVPCIYGVEGPTGDELVRGNPVELAKLWGVDTAEFLPRDEVQAAADQASPEPGGWCDACFSGVYPVQPEVDDQLALFDGVRPSEG